MTAAPKTSVQDVSVLLTFNPVSPMAATEVEIAPDCGLDHAGLLELLASCVERLEVYRTGYLAAMREDGPVAPLSYSR